MANGGWGLDERSLGAMRIALGLAIAGDTLATARHAHDLLSDVGVMPRHVLFYLIPKHWGLSLFASFGAGALAVATLLVLSASALCFAAGWHTQRSGFVCWVLLAALQARNPYIAHGGDALARLLLTFALFTPSASRLSVDALLFARRQHSLETTLQRTLPPRKRDPGVQRKAMSAGVLAFAVQSQLIHFVTGWMKMGKTWEPDLTAVHYTLHIDLAVTGIGKWFLAVCPDELLRASCAVVLYAERFLPPLLLLVAFAPPRRLHTWLLYLSFVPMCGMQFAFGSMLVVGMFPIFSLVSYVALLPGSAWEVAETWAARKSRFGLCSEFWRARLPHSQSWLSSVLVTTMLVFALLYNVQAYQYMTRLVALDTNDEPPNLVAVADHVPLPRVIPASWLWVGELLWLEQVWDMFAPWPNKSDGWFVVGMTDSRGMVTNRMDEQPCGHASDAATLLKCFDKPAVASRQFPTWRWLQFYLRLWSESFKEALFWPSLHGFARFLCLDAQRRGADVNGVEVYFVHEETSEAGNGSSWHIVEQEPRKLLLWGTHCGVVGEGPLNLWAVRQLKAQGLVW